ncbi:MAG: cupin domain-containing protein [Solirubrobacterales bacterium]|nr:cupin domain-containing protein [Solirubrobacterales bacterium]
MDLETVIRELRLEPLAREGGKFRRKFRDKNSTSIYFLLERGFPTMFHRLPGPELFHFYTGAPVRIQLLGPEPGEGREASLGIDLAGGERPQILVRGNTWQAAETTGEWSLIGTTMAPGFDWDRFTLAARERLIHGWPDHREVIEHHTEP